MVIIEKILEWFATLAVVVAAILLANNYAFAASVSFFSGSVAWAIVGLMWKKNSLMILNLFLSAIYIVGWTKDYFLN